MLSIVTYISTFDPRIGVEKYISEMTNIHNVVMFWMMIWCQFHLCGCS